MFCTLNAATGFGLIPLPLQLQFWGVPHIRPMIHFRGHALSLLLGLLTLY